MWEGGSVAFWFEVLKPKKHIGIDLRAITDSTHFQKYVNSRGFKQSPQNILEHKPSRLKAFKGTCQTGIQRDSFLT